jgi:hypothetical protein
MRRYRTIKNIARNAEGDCTQLILKRKEYALSVQKNLLQKVIGKGVKTLVTVK